jgi:hypothetical protein
VQHSANSQRYRSDRDRLHNSAVNHLLSDTSDPLPTFTLKVEDILKAEVDQKHPYLVCCIRLTLYTSQTGVSPPQKMLQRSPSPHTSPVTSLRPVQSRSRASSPRHNHRGSMPMAAWRRPESQGTPREEDVVHVHGLSSSHPSSNLSATQDSSVFGDSVCFGDTLQSYEFAPGQLKDLLDNSRGRPSMSTAMPALQAPFNQAPFSSDDEGDLGRSCASFAASRLEF